MKRFTVGNSGSIFSVLTGAILLAAGCMPRDLDPSTLRSMIPPPAPQLRELNRLEGDWKTSGSIRFLAAREAIETTGENTAAWACDGRYLVDRSTYTLGPIGTMSGVSIWTWDDREKRYRIWWFDGLGESAQGTARFDAGSRTWQIRTRGSNGRCSVRSHGTIRHVNKDHLEWTWRQWDGWGIFRISEMRGTSVRQGGGGSSTEAGSSIQ